jgi:outer membrane autotransporter protein
LTVGNDIAGVGALTKNGAGTLDLFGANTYTGSTTVNEGRLNVRGSIAGSVLVNQNGSLSGNGAVGATDVFGRIAPGNSIGTLTVNGNFVQNAGSTYEVEVNAAGQSDRIQVNGSATINGGTILVVPAAGNYTGGTRYVIVHATNGVTGRYSALIVTPGITSREFKDVYIGNEVLLAVLFNRDELLSNTQTFNQRSVANTLADPNIPSSLISLFNSLRVLTVGELGMALDELTGAINGTALSYARVAAMQTNLLLNDQLHSTLFRCGDNEIAPGYSSWLQTRGALGQIHGDGNVSSYQVGSGGFLTGIDRWLSDSSRIGLYGGYNFWQLHQKGYGDRAAVNAFDVGLDGSQTFENFYALGNVGYGYNNYHVKRQINYFGFQGYPETTYGGNLFNLGGEVGGAWNGNGFAVKPLAALQYQYISNNRFVETGGGATNLVGDSQNAMALWGSVGSRFSYCLDYYGLYFQARAQARYLHDFLGDDRSSNMRFEAGGAPFQIQGARTGQNYCWSSLGFSLGAGAIRVNFDYSILASTRQVTHIGNAGFDLQW